MVVILYPDTEHVHLINAVTAHGKSLHSTINNEASNLPSVIVEDVFNKDGERGTKMGAKNQNSSCCNNGMPCFFCFFFWNIWRFVGSAYFFWRPTQRWRFQSQALRPTLLFQRWPCIARKIQRRKTSRVFSLLQKFLKTLKQAVGGRRYVFKRVV